MKKKVVSILILLTLLLAATGIQKCTVRKENPTAVNESNNEKNQVLKSSPPFLKDGLVHILISISLFFIWFLIYKSGERKENKRRRRGL